VKEWNKPEIVARFTKDDIFVNEVLADHTNYSNSYVATYKATYNQAIKG
jgi:hypothetical protein